MQEILGLEELGARDDRKFMVVVAMPMLRAAIDDPLSEGVLNLWFLLWVCVIRLERE